MCAHTSSHLGQVCLFSQPLDFHIVLADLWASIVFMFSQPLDFNIVFVQPTFGLPACDIVVTFQLAYIVLVYGVFHVVVFVVCFKRYVLEDILIGHGVVGGL